MKYLLAIILLTTLTVYSQGQNDEKITTIILIRHAEKVKDGTKDPLLTEVGIARANRLIELLKNADIDAIYSSPFKRTHQTVAPIAKSLGIDVKEYSPYQENFIYSIYRQNIGHTILVSGHSNTTPFAVNSLIGNDKYKDIDDDEYGRIFIVTKIGDSTADVLEIQY